jgi:hypothetical protein
MSSGSDGLWGKLAKLTLQVEEKLRALLLKENLLYLIIMSWHSPANASGVGQIP